jgi:hypothetical protein
MATHQHNLVYYIFSNSIFVHWKNTHLHHILKNEHGIRFPWYWLLCCCSFRTPKAHEMDYYKDHSSITGYGLGSWLSKMWEHLSGGLFTTTRISFNFSLSFFLFKFGLFFIYIFFSTFFFTCLRMTWNILVTKKKIKFNIFEIQNEKDIDV